MIRGDAGGQSHTWLDLVSILGDAVQPVQVTTAAGLCYLPSPYNLCRLLQLPFQLHSHSSDAPKAQTTPPPHTKCGNCGFLRNKNAHLYEEQGPALVLEPNAASHSRIIL